MHQMAKPEIIAILEYLGFIFNFCTSSLHPRLNIRPPSQFIGVHVHHTTPNIHKKQIIIVKVADIQTAAETFKGKKEPYKQPSLDTMQAYKNMQKDFRLGLKLTSEQVCKYRLTVAGEATARSCTSNNICMVLLSLILSLLAKQSILLSSKTVFMFSIHKASTGPSHTIHLWSSVVSCLKVKRPYQ